jgi:hypothetical protein
LSDSKKHLILEKPTTSEPTIRKSIDTFGQRTSIYHGVTRHRWTRHYEAHLWDNNCKREGKTCKGKQVYLGGYSKDEKTTYGPQNDNTKFIEDEYIKAYQAKLMKRYQSEYSKVMAEDAPTKCHVG